jgi:hypothetical protein
MFVGAKIKMAIERLLQCRLYHCSSTPVAPFSPQT